MKPVPVALGVMNGEPPPNAAALRHALKDRLHARVFQHVVGEVDERLVDVGVGHGGGDAVEVGLGHGLSGCSRMHGGGEQWKCPS